MNENAQRTFASVGSGLIGRSWAIRFACAGWRAILVDRDRAALEAGLEMARRSVVAARDAGVLLSPDDVMARISIADSLSEAVAVADWVQESVLENVDVKKRVWGEIDLSCKPSAILGSSTSALLASSFMHLMAHRNRGLVVHPALPPHVIPLVELSPAAWTDDSTVHEAAAILRSIGSQPVVLHREVPGFIWNRLQIALIKEGMNLIADGYCTPADIDDVFVNGLGLRLAFTGVMESMHLGLLNGFSEMSVKFPAFPTELPYQVYEQWPAPQKLEKAMSDILEYAELRVPVEDLDSRRRWREKMIIKLLRLKEQSE
jgi:L-gulonate 3-dehydrogenase